MVSGECDSLGRPVGVQGSDGSRLQRVLDIDHLEPAASVRDISQFVPQDEAHRLTGRVPLSRQFWRRRIADIDDGQTRRAVGYEGKASVHGDIPGFTLSIQFPFEDGVSRVGDVDDIQPFIAGRHKRQGLFDFNREPTTEIELGEPDRVFQIGDIQNNQAVQEGAVGGLPLDTDILGFCPQRGSC